MKERLISFIRFANNRNLEYFNLLDIFMHLFKSIIHEDLNINVLKDKEGDQISVDNMHTLKSCGRESIDSPVVGIFTLQQLMPSMYLSLQTLSPFLTLL